MKKFFALSVIGTSLIISSNSAKADVIIPSGTIFSGFNSGNPSAPIPGMSLTDAAKGIYTFTQDINCANPTGSKGQYVSVNSSSAIVINAACNEYAGSFLGENASGDIIIGKGTKIITIKENEINMDGAAVITKNSDGSVQIGADGNDIDITAEGVNVDGNPLITKKDNGEIHIGKNSLITKSEEETLSDGRKVQPLYAKDADGNKIPINIDGSKLLIDGVEVIAGGDNAQVTTNKNNISTNTSNISTNKANIKNLGEGVAGSTALTAALSALPQTSKESKLSCGVGTGAYSSRYAVGFGCASKVNERVDVNAGGSYVFGGSKSYGGGTLDSGVLKAGFVFKFGELKKTTQISMKEKKEFKKEISILKENNKNILSKNQKLENQVFTLMARLERLEKIALSETTSKDVAVYKLK